jgi:ABC-2 type transport system ATP-binding protein
VVTVHEQRVYEGDGSRSGRKPPTAQEVQDALAALGGVTTVVERPTDDRAHSFQLMGPLGTDIRPEIFQLIVQKGWLLLEMRRESQTLEDVFKTLTKGDERKDRGRRPLLEEEEDEIAARTAGGVDEDEDGGTRAATMKAPTMKAPTMKAPTMKAPTTKGKATTAPRATTRAKATTRTMRGTTTPTRTRSPTRTMTGMARMTIRTKTKSPRQRRARARRAS